MLLDKERTFPCTCAIIEAMRQNCTRHLRKDYSPEGKQHTVCTRGRPPVAVCPPPPPTRDFCFPLLKVGPKTLEKLS